MVKWLERLGYGAEGHGKVVSSTRSRGYKTFFMLNSVEHEVFNAHK